MMRSLVSVVVPNYNSAKYISDTIESISGQTLDDWELIIVDDCSTDNSVSLIGDFCRRDPRIKLIRLERNSGNPARPRNIGISMAGGEYIALLDSDDIWHPQKLEIQLSVMEKQHVPFTSSCVLNFRSLEEIHGPLNERYHLDQIGVLPVGLKRLLYKNIIPNSSVVARRELFHERRFTEDVRYRAIEDYHCWLNIHHQIEYSCKVQVPLLFYRLSEGSISKSKVAMLKKNYMLYSEYEFQGKRLGSRRYLYLSTYIYFSIVNRLIGGQV
jgi:teichuronic acid biosynthesis glycosyltransferase TuaG